MSGDGLGSITQMYRASQAAPTWQSGLDGDLTANDMQSLGLDHIADLKRRQDEDARMKLLISGMGLLSQGQQPQTPMRAPEPFAPVALAPHGAIPGTPRSPYQANPISPYLFRG